ncbi:MAG: benzoate-CoA ligase family protein [Firmicutes bacterium]|nr:benzoate-CoA ligase family protein [Bacillota bacterium]
MLIVLPDSAEFVAAFFGTVKIGAVAVPVNPFTRAGDYAYYLSDCAPRVAVVHAVALAEFLPALQTAPPERLVVVGAQWPVRYGGPAVTWEEWLGQASESLEAHRTLATDPAFFLYTSGSGGTPKAAIHQHKDMLVTTESYARGVLGLQADDITFSVSKLFFAYGLGNGMYFPFAVGAQTVYLAARPQPELVLELVVRYRPTVFFSVPTFYAALLRAIQAGARADFSSVRMAVSAGEALPAELFEQFQRQFGLEILDGIGSTEMLHMFIANRPGAARPGTCGIPVPNYEARIVDEAGRDVRPGEIGSLWVRGASAFAGYWNKPELTARNRVGDWVVTGDKFFRDADGYYHYCGRTDDMMKVSGMWVAPAEVENALLGHPDVAEAAVVGKNDHGLTHPVAFVVLRAGVAPSRELPQQLQAFVRARLASYKVPQQIHFVTELPKTATGKIQRYRLREQA